MASGYLSMEIIIKRKGKLNFVFVDPLEIFSAKTVSRMCP